MAAVSLPGSPASGAPFLGRSDKFGKHVRSIFPETGFMTNFSTRKILVGIDDGGSCLARTAFTLAAQSVGAGATGEISPWLTEGAATKATSVSFW
jgi:hypothetical protein